MRKPETARFTTWRRLTVLLAVLVTTAVVVPQATVSQAPVSLVKVRTAEGVGHSPDVVWVLFLGSDARPGQSVVRSRADAIQLVGVNLRTGAGSIIGIPRDSFVSIPGHGRNKINAAMYFGGPELMARSVSGLVGVRPDYVFTAGFDGFRHMVNAIGGITVHSRFSFSDPVKPKGYHRGQNRLTGFQALIFGRIRKPLPRGDFDRSANQQELLRAILREVRGKRDRPGFMERGVFSVARNLHTDLRPSELYRLAQSAALLEPRKLRGCVVRGSTGYVGAASVVFPDVAQARRLGNQARDDATIGRGC